MRYDRINMTVQGQKTGEARLTAYLLDPVSVLPKRARPLVIVVPGGGYQYCSDREREPIVMKFLAMGCHACILDYSVSPNRFPVGVSAGLRFFGRRTSGMQHRNFLESFRDL